ncbi:MAG: hypothetical protein HLUCCA08_04425 [Rhodobacteraceae bacterium HLUCCA08]|nr:MAG: hypothetical protein HLUCCA08_04425 [Rhodobacteraceae bacterium HLUCCA08]
MSNSDSFIDEVTEEVRRDRLFATLRRYGWIGILAVLLLVGGAAFLEWRKAQATRAAQATGDAILATFGTTDEAARAEQLLAVPAGDARVVTALLAAADLQAAGDGAGAVAALQAVATDGDVDPVYRDLAALKAAMIGGDDSLDDRRVALDALAQPGRPFRLLAEEQLAYLEVAAGETEAALVRLEAIAGDAEVTPNLRDRAESLIVALGGTPAAQ